MQRRSLDISEVKLATDSKAGTFKGYLAVFGNRDSYDDVIEKGAFAQTLREWSKKGRLPPMLMQHGGGMFSGSVDNMLPPGLWTSMEEDSKGLKVEGRLIGLNTERGAYLHEAMKEGAIDGLSIGYRTRESRRGTQPGEPTRTLTNIDLREGSIVTIPANDRALVSSVKSVSLDELREFEAHLRDAGVSHKDAVMAIACLKKFDAWRFRDGGAVSPRDAVPSVVDDESSDDTDDLKGVRDALSAFRKSLDASSKEAPPLSDDDDLLATLRSAAARTKELAR